MELPREAFLFLSHGESLLRRDQVTGNLDTLKRLNLGLEIPARSWWITQVQIEPGLPIRWTVNTNYPWESKNEQT